MSPDLYVSLRPKMIRLALRYVHSQARAEDAVDAAFAAALAHFDRDQPRNVSAWVGMIVRNVCLHEIRDGKKRAETPPEHWEPAAPANSVPKVLRDEVVERVDAALLTLTGDQRLALELFHFEGLDHQEVAEIMESSPGAVRALVHRAKRRMYWALRAVGEAS